MITNGREMVTSVWLPGATGSGPFEVASSWATAFEAKFPEADFTLSSVGSGAAQAAMWGEIDCVEKPVDDVCDQNEIDRTVWGMGDAPLNPNVYVSYPEEDFQQFPACAGAVAVVYSNEVTKGSEIDLKLTFDVLAAIFNQSISFWDDDRLVALNPEHELPHIEITVIVREDSSGQTNIFTDALGFNVETWPKEAIGKRPDWPLEDIGPYDSIQQLYNRTGDVPNSFSADGKTGVSLGMIRVPYSIGYMEFGYASSLSDFLSMASLMEPEIPGTFVSPTAESVNTTMDALVSTLDKETLDLNLATETLATEGAYPMAGYAYIYLKKNPEAFTSCYQAWLLCQFVEFAYTDPLARELAQQEGWIVPPGSVVTKALARLDDVMCFDTENGKTQVIAARGYIPIPYRVVEETDYLLIGTISGAAFIIVGVLVCQWRDRRRHTGDHLWQV